jgi:DNA-binding FadR family transcriptional regulator
VNTALLFAFNAAIRVPGLARASLPRHQAILEAIRRRQPNQARALMSRLVENTGRAIEKLPRRRSKRGLTDARPAPRPSARASR